jgi:hypothetical protein
MSIFVFQRPHCLGSNARNAGGCSMGARSARDGKQGSGVATGQSETLSLVEHRPSLERLHDHPTKATPLPTADWTAAPVRRPPNVHGSLHCAR